MSEIYWITRLSAINNFLMIIAIFSSISLVIGLIGWIVNEVDIANYKAKGDKFYNDAIEECKVCLYTFKKIFKISICFALFSYIGLIFIPSTQQAYIIYSVGGTIDYIKSNNKAKQLPDKCIDALTRYVDSIEKENK